MKEEKVKNMFFKKSEKSSKAPPSDLSWTNVEKYLSEKTRGGSAMALIETEKILEAVLKKLQYPGKNNDSRLIPAKEIIANYEDLAGAREVTGQLKEKLNSEISPEEARETLKAYFEAIRFLSQAPKEKIGLFEKINRRVKRFYPNFKKILGTSIFGFFVFFLLIYLLDATKLGQSLVDLLTGISHFIFSWILFTFLLVIGILVIVVSTIFYFERRKEKKITASR